MPYDNELTLPVTKRIPCPTCGGRGESYCFRSDGQGGPMDCPACKGKCFVQVAAEPLLWTLSQPGKVVR